jgi:putative aminopeptidase FrvX
MMRKESFEFLQRLVAAPSPSGYEQPAQRVFRDYVAPFARVTTDVMGNAFAYVKGARKDPPRVMLIGHSDEIGFQVKYIDDNGFIYFGAIGGGEHPGAEGEPAGSDRQETDTPHGAQGP